MYLSTVELDHLATMEYDKEVFSSENSTVCIAKDFDHPG